MLRFAALLGTGALAVHQLRYLLAGHAPNGPQHAYLGPVGSLLAGVLVLAMARGLVASRARRVSARWPVTAAALVAIYCVQELGEGLSPVAHGGWLALPLALLVALGITLLTRGRAATDLRPWRAPAPARRAVLLAFELQAQARSAAPLLLPPRGPPVGSH